jgi:phage-related protein
LLIDNKINLYNPGVKESDCVITLKTKNNIGYSLSFGDIGMTLEWPEGTDRTLRLDSKNNLVIDANTGEILNEYVTEGDFFKIPLGEPILNVEEFRADTTTENNEKAQNNEVTIDYNYYYY